jgi:tetratricopeptide (TPR) repeat protein
LLYQAYLKTGNDEKAKSFFNKHKNILSQASTGDERKEVVLRLPSEVRTKIENAVICLQSNEIEKAYTLLTEANKIKETNIAHRFLGDILLQKKDKKALYHLKKVYKDYNSDPNFLNTLCYACIFFKDFEYAGKILPELKQLSPDNKYIPSYEKAIAEKK